MKRALATLLVAHAAAAEVPLPSEPPAPPPVNAELTNVVAEPADTNVAAPYRVMPRWVFVTSAGVGTAAVVFAFVASMMASDTSSLAIRSVTASQARDLDARANTLATAANLAILASVALAINTGVLSIFTRWSGG